MTEKTLTIGVIAGEVSGDLLGGDLIAALRETWDGRIDLMGVGGEALERQGLKSLFDFSELSIMGISQVLMRLPLLLRRIRQTADATDHYVRAHPWEVLAGAAVVGFVAGFLLNRR